MSNKKPGKIDKEDVEDEILNKVQEQDQEDESFRRKKTSAIPGILEKGIVYFLFRGRVGIEDPRSIDDIARSFIALQPLLCDEKVSAGTSNVSGNARLLVLPKKMLPKKHGSAFLAFVEKSALSVMDLRHEVSETEYDIKYLGTRHVPPITPFAEGVYAIVSQSQRSHLVYQIAYPEIGEVQKEFGLHKRGSYIVSARNPKFPGPSNLPLRHPPMYSESIQKKFRGLRWIPLTPELLDYNNTRLLLIGEGLGVMRKEEDSG